MKKRNYTTCKTKIIATIGPSSRSKQVLKKMILSGMNVARLNLSHGSYEDHAEIIRRIRSLSEELNTSVAILLDLQGPKLRTGKLKDGKPVMLKRNSTIRFTTKKILGTCDLIPTTYANLTADVNKDEEILLNDGLIKLKVVSKNHDTVIYSDCSQDRKR
jgi:pyruvate kinase